MSRTALVRAARVAAVAAAAATSPLRAAAPMSSWLLAARRAPLAVPRLRGGVPVREYSDGSALDREVVEGRIMSLLHGFDKVNDASNIKPTAHFVNDLGLDSLDTVEVVMAIEEEFSIEIPDKDADQIHSVDQAVEYILRQPDAN